MNRYILLQYYDHFNEIRMHVTRYKNPNYRKYLYTLSQSLNDFLAFGGDKRR